MTHIPDGSNIRYRHRKEQEDLYSWGWLGDKVPRKYRGWDDPKEKAQFVEFLKGVPYKYRSDPCMGMHECEICLKARKKNEKPKRRATERFETREEWFKHAMENPSPPEEPIAEFNGELVVEHEGTEYRAPFEVFHYVEAHDYNPGEDVVNAVMNGELQIDPFMEKIYNE